MNGRWSRGGGSYDTWIFLAKARVATMTSALIPRLELSAAVRENEMVRTAIRLKYTDRTAAFCMHSAIAFHHICNVTIRFGNCIAKKLTAIHDGTKIDEGRHLISANNSSGLCCREVTNIQLLKMILLCSHFCGFFHGSCCHINPAGWKLFGVILSTLKA